MLKHIRDICQVKSGKRLPDGHDFCTMITDYRYIRARNIKEGKIDDSDLAYIMPETQGRIKKYIVKTGDIALTIAGTIGEVAYVNADFDGVNLTENAVRLTEFDQNVDSHYVFYVLSSSQFKQKMQSLAAGAAQPKLGIYKIEEIEVEIPDLPTQHRIASILSVYDDLIENNRRQIKLLEEAAQRLYREWFVELRFPGHENVKIVDGVPEGWKVVFLGDVIEFDPKVPLTKDRMKQSVPMAALSASSMVLDQSLIENTMSNSGSKFKNGDSLLARITPCLENGKTAFVDCLDCDEGAVGSTEFIVMRSKNLNPYMVYCIARSDCFRTEAINSMTGSDGRQRAQKDKLKALSYILPPKSLIDRFEQFAQPCFDKIRVLNRQNGFLVKARDKLLPKLMSGEMEE